MDMDDRILSATFFNFPQSPQHHQPIHPIQLIRSPAPLDAKRYLAELLAERQKLGPFVKVLPFCTRLLNQEILLASGLGPTQNFVDRERIEQSSPFRLVGHHSNGGSMDLEGWPEMQMEENGYLQRMGVLQSPMAGWNGAPGLTAVPLIKKVIRMDVPVDKFPNFNFVGQLLGPRGNSLKKVEAVTQCRVFIRGRGSVKDSLKEEKLRDKPGYEHLNDPLHVLVEAEFPADMVDARLRQAVNIVDDLLKPVDESRDYYKKNQLRELAILNGTLREESPSPHMSPSMSPFNGTGMKRPKSEM